MATMIPPIVPHDAPGSERRVFEAIRDASGSELWTVLHSLGISSAWTGDYGEIDFVVIIPKAGIICAEVKGGKVSHKNGVWFTRRMNSDIPIALKRSPFRQAQEGMWKLKQALASKFGAASFEARCPLGWMAIFPDIDCPPVTPEFSRAEVIDQSDLALDIAEKLLAAPSLAQLQTRTDLAAPSPATCRRILTFLRPDFDRVVMATTDAWDTERRIRSLTEEQYEILDAISENQTCVVKGPAGTGKTNIAIEAARRLSLSGNRVVLACFNAPLGSWLQKCLADFGLDGITAGHLHGLLRERIVRSTLGGDLPSSDEIDKSALFGKLYFELGALAIDEIGERFDVVILDETQDFEPSRIADVANAWTHGVVGARVILFGDFTRQALYGRPKSELEDLRAAFGGAPVFGLSINCRNTRRIATQTDLMCGFTGTKVLDKQVDGDPVQVFFVSSRSEAVERLGQIVSTLRNLGIRPGDAIILGPRRRENSILAGVNAAGGWRITDMYSAKPDELPYATIHQFKGLERPVVIAVDAGASNSDETDSLLYVAMTRARIRLFVICPEEVRPIIEQRTMDALKTLAGTS